MGFSGGAGGLSMFCGAEIPTKMRTTTWHCSILGCEWLLLSSPIILRSLFVSSCDHPAWPLTGEPWSLPALP